MTYEEWVIQWYKDRARLYTAWGEALRLMGPPMARREEERYLKLFMDDSDSQR
ncbi:hypothetical protein LCGC14_0793040 [marine sediment metagenome]|uniref:Uncharacterized protein n=1 Tax=marine sediment metagenome TaxID=412755 RepID=A0A0F9PWA4_9ZZZZ